MKRIYYHIAVVVVLIMSFSISWLAANGIQTKFFTITGHALINDELTYIPSGYYYLTTGRYFLNPEHPPLVKDVAGLPALWLQPEFPARQNIPSSTVVYEKSDYPYQSFVFPLSLELVNKQWKWGRVFLLSESQPGETLIVWSRTMVLIANYIFLALLIFSLRSWWGKRGSLLALMFLAFSPLTFAFAPIVILDYTVAILQLLTVVWFAKWLKDYLEEKSHGKSLVLVIVFITLAMLAKASTLVLFPILWLTGIIYAYFKTSSIKKSFFITLWWCVIGVSNVILSVIVYYFHSTGMSGFEIKEQLQGLLAQSAIPVRAHSLLLTLVRENSWTHALVEYLLGMAMTLKRVDDAVQRTYFMCEIYGFQGLSRWYYPVLIITKTPLVTWILMVPIIGVVLGQWILKNKSIKEKLVNSVTSPSSPDSGNKSSINNILIITLFVFGLSYFLIAWVNRLQMGIRYMVPSVFAGLLLLAYYLNIYWNEVIVRFIRVKHLAIGGILVLIVTMLAIFPYYISYYNWLGGGIEKGHFIAVDSNYDWGGQDLKRLAQWMQTHRDKTVYLDVFSIEPEQYYLGDTFLPYNLRTDPVPSPGSVMILSAHQYQMYRVDPKTGPIIEKYFSLDKRQEVVGSTMFIFTIQ